MVFDGDQMGMLERFAGCFSRYQTSDFWNPGPCELLKLGTCNLNLEPLKISGDC